MTDEPTSQDPPDLIEDERPLPCAHVTCPICLARLRALAVDAAKMWRAYCKHCYRMVELKAEKRDPQQAVCRHVLADGRQCSDVVKCVGSFPLEQP